MRSFCSFQCSSGCIQCQCLVSVRLLGCHVMCSQITALAKTMDDLLQGTLEECQGLCKSYQHVQVPSSFHHQLPPNIFLFFPLATRAQTVCFQRAGVGFCPQSAVQFAGAVGTADLGNAVVLRLPPSMNVRTSTGHTPVAVFELCTLFVSTLTHR